MLTKVVYGGAFPMVAGCVTPNRVWRHTGVKSLKNHHVRGNQKFNVLADSKDSPLEWSIMKKPEVCFVCFLANTKVQS